jgi:hypothetical protein
MNTFFFNFDNRVPVTVQRVISSLYQTGVRVRVWYGDTVTGQAWPEEFDVLGTIGKSTGSKPVPLVINNSRSSGGSAILTHCILRIDRTDSGGTLYIHDNFKHGITVQGCQVFCNDQLHTSCTDEKRAQRLGAFLKGERYSK